jgi:protein-tyrosine-phosphatase
MTTPEQIVLFVCPHGAGKSRLAAAWFQASAPPGWRGTSAGTTPQEAVSEHAPRLLAGTGVAHLLDNAPPRHVSAVPQPDLVVAIDCPPDDVKSATLHWRLHNTGFDEAMRDELRTRAESLAEHLAASEG